MAAPSEPRNAGNPGPVPFFVRFVATGFFSGYSPVASGTAGSIVGALIWVLPWFRQPPVQIAASALLLLIGVWVSSRMEQAFGEDPSIVVVDEIDGMWITMLFIPFSIPLLVAGFFLFRLFDIIKPPPAKRLERIGGGWGIMLDDVAAALYANMGLRILLYAVPSLG